MLNFSCNTRLHLTKNIFYENSFMIFIATVYLELPTRNKLIFIFIIERFSILTLRKQRAFHHIEIS